MADIPIPPIPSRRAPLIDIMRELEARPRQRQPQEFDPVAALAAERRSQSRQPLPLPPTPPAASPPPQPGEAQAGAGTPLDLSAVAPTIRSRLPEGNPYVAAAIDIAEKYNLPRDVFLSLVHQESKFDPKAKSPRGAFGLAQLMPGTARELGVDPRDPMANLDAGARYLRQQLDRFGSLPLALAAYNAGPQRVIDAGRAIPNIRETQDYVHKIMRNSGMEGYGYAEGGRVRESLVDMEDRYAGAPTVRSADEEYDRRLMERDPLITPASRLGVAGVPVPRGGREMYPGNALSPFEAAASLVPTMEGVQRGMMSAMAGVDIPEGARVVQTDMTRSGYAIETADGRLIDPEGRQGRDVREFAGTTRRSAVLPVSQDVETGERSLDVPALLDMLPMAGVQGGPAGALGAGRSRRALGTAEEVLAAPRSDFPYLTEPMKLTDRERAALLAEPKPQGVGVRNEPPTGSMDVMASDPVVFRGREPKEWSPQDWGDYGREYGVPNLGPRSNDEWQRSLVDVDIGGRRISVPGGLDTDAPFTYYDLLHLKSQGIDPSTMPRDVHVALQRRMLASVTPEPGDPLAAYNGLIMGFASPNNPLFPNQMAMTRLRARSMEDVERLADMIPWKAGDEVPKSLRSQYDTRIAEAFGLDKGPEKGKAGTPATAAIPPSPTFIGQPARKATPDIAPSIGGTGARGSADYTRMAEFAQMFRDRPDFFTFRGAAEGGEDLANQWSNFVERLVSQTPGLSAKTGSFGAVWQDPATAAISAIDRHMANQIGSRMFRSDEARDQFFGNVLQRYNEGVGLKGDQKRRRIEDGQVRSIDEMLEREEGQTFLQDQLLQAAGQHKTPKYRVGREGQLNPSMPEHLTPDAARWVREPENMALISDAYRAALSENARMAQREGLGLFGSQWLNWDRIRRRLEPHENMFPNLSNLPTMSLEQLNEARRAHRATGETDYKKVAPTAEEQAAAASVGEDLGSGLRLRPVRPIENPSRLGYFAVPPAYFAGELGGSLSGDDGYAKGGLAALDEKYAEGGTVRAPKKTTIAGQDHRLAYITDREAALLKARGGSGRMTKYGVRSYEEGPGGDPSDNANSMSESATQDAVGGNQGQGAGPTGAGAGSGPPGGPDSNPNEDAGTETSVTAPTTASTPNTGAFGQFGAATGLGVVGGLASFGIGVPGLGTAAAGFGAALDAAKANEQLGMMGLNQTVDRDSAVANAVSMGAFGQSVANQFGQALGFDALAEAPMSAFSTPNPLGDIAASQMDSGGSQYVQTEYETPGLSNIATSMAPATAASLIDWNQLQREASAMNMSLSDYLAMKWRSPATMARGGMASLEQMHAKYAEGGEVYPPQGEVAEYNPEEIDRIARQIHLRFPEDDMPRTTYDEVESPTDLITRARLLMRGQNVGQQTVVGTGRESDSAKASTSLMNLPFEDDRYNLGQRVLGNNLEIVLDPETKSRLGIGLQAIEMSGPQGGAIGYMPQISAGYGPLSLQAGYRRMTPNNLGAKSQDSYIYGGNLEIPLDEQGAAARLGANIMAGRRGTMGMGSAGTQITGSLERPLLGGRLALELAADPSLRHKEILLGYRRAF